VNFIIFGVAIAAAQNKGAVQEDGRSLSIWDVFACRKGGYRERAKPSVVCDFITGTKTIFYW
jgi:beta-glucosidase